MEDYNLEEAAKQYRDEFLDKNDNDISKYDIEDIFIDGANWQYEQFEKERLKHCDEMTAEQAQIESDFVVQHLEKYNSTPTYSDAIEYGRKAMREKLSKLKELANNMYNEAQSLPTSDSFRFYKALGDYRKYVVYELKED